MSSKEKNYKKIMIITIITSIIVVLGTVSYAFYQTTINGTVSGTIAKWSFTANNQTDSFDLNLGELYPGKSGTYNITLSAADSGLDVYYELIFTDATINSKLYWDSSYTKSLGGTDSYVGRYGVIPKGSSVTIPLYLNWPYNDPDNEIGIDIYQNYYMPQIEIIAKQYTGYSGSIPMNLLGYNLLSYKSAFKEIMPVNYSSTCKLNVESINSTSGYLIISSSNKKICIPK